MSVSVQQASIDAPALPQAAALDHALRTASPAEVIEAALKTIGRERLALVSSFGTESAALLKVMADVDPAIPWSSSTPAGCSRRRWPIATR